MKNILSDEDCSDLSYNSFYYSKLASKCSFFSYIFVSYVDKKSNKMVKLDETSANPNKSITQWNKKEPEFN